MASLLASRMVHVCRSTSPFQYGLGFTANLRTHLDLFRTGFVAREVATALLSHAPSRGVHEVDAAIAFFTLTFAPTDMSPMVCLEGALCRSNGALGDVDLLRAAQCSVWELGCQRPLAKDTDECLVPQAPTTDGITVQAGRPITR